jgi:predicted dehydrogenase
VQDLTELNFADLVNFEELAIDDVEPLRAELDAFLDAATGRSPPEVSAEDGLAAVELATRIVQSIAPQSLDESS